MRKISFPAMKCLLLTVALFILTSSVVGRALADDHGDSWDTATSIGTDGTSVAGVIDPSYDQDWFAFDAIAGHEYLIATGDDLDTVIYLIGSNGVTELDWDDDGGPNYSSLIYWTCPTSGTYYVRVESYGTGTGNYTLSVEPWSSTPDDHGNTAATATSIGTDGTSVAGVIDPSYDPDWFSFSAIAGHEYRIATGGSLDTVIFLIDIDGLAELDSDDDGGDEWLSLIHWTCPTSGTYYVRVKSYGTNTGNYTLSVEDQRGSPMSWLMLLL